jgi:hypothetical protein
MLSPSAELASIDDFSLIEVPVAAAARDRALGKKTGIEMRQYPEQLQRYLTTKSSVYEKARRSVSL